jgi:saccharopine dehydrogenase-like NADP-dependent oxidoreductase
MKKVMIIGAGARGSTIAKRLNEEENVSQIICADYDLKAAVELGKTLDKATAVKVKANDVIQQKGAIAPEVLNATEKKYFFNEAQKFDITTD